MFEDLGHVEKLAWIGIGFPLGSACVVLLVGKLYDRFEIKWLFLTTVVLFEAGSALCGAAPNMDALIVGRFLAGFGAGVYVVEQAPKLLRAFFADRLMM